MERGKSLQLIRGGGLSPLVMMTLYKNQMQKSSWNINQSHNTIQRKVIVTIWWNKNLQTMCAITYISLK